MLGEITDEYNRRFFIKLGDFTRKSYEWDNIEETVEPFLIQLGLIQRTPRGRMLTPQAF